MGALRGDEIMARSDLRFDVALPALVRVAPEHAQQFRLRSSICDPDGWMEAELVDVSVGGLGILATVVLPRRCRLQIRVFGTQGRTGSPLLEAFVIVQRVVMTDRRPAFMVGTTFVAGAMSVAAVDDVIALIEGGVDA